MQAVALAKSEAYRRGHLPMRDDARRGRAALICARCGAQAVHVNRELRGALVGSGWGRCFPEPVPEPEEPRLSTQGLVRRAWAMHVNRIEREMREQMRGTR